MDLAYWKMPTGIHAVKNTLGVVEGSYKILNVDKEIMTTEGRQDEGVAGDYRIDTFGKGNDGTDSFGQAWIASSRRRP
jgi:hypothetical protein